MTADPRQPTWYVRVRDANGGEQVYEVRCQPGVTDEDPEAWAMERHTRLTDALPVSVVSTELVDEYHLEATRLHRKWPAELEGGTEPGTDMYVNVGEHSIRVPAEHVIAVLNGLETDVAKAREAIAAWPDPEPDDWDDR
jgi:hypothetical protein